jgi:hypothetical protein
MIISHQIKRTEPKNTILETLSKKCVLKCMLVLENHRRGSGEWTEPTTWIN